MNINPDTPFKVLTYNIRTGKGIDNEQDLNRIVTVLRQSQAQLIGLQEVDCYNPERSGNIDQGAVLADALNMEHHFVPALVNPFLYGNAILSTFPILERRELILPKKETNEERSVAAIKIIVAGVPLIFVTTHLSLSSAERFRQVKLLMEFLPTNTPIILVGDWNSEPESPTYNKVTERLVDVARYLGLEQPTFPVFSPKDGEKRRRIDYIFVSEEIVIQDVKVIDSPASDHYPVLATLAIRR